MTSLRTPIHGASLALLVSSVALGQVEVHQRQGEAPGDAFGASLAVVSDLDGDGVADLWVGAPKTDFGGVNAGSAYLLSGASGATLIRMDATAQGGLFGRALAGIGDLDGDGTGDLLVGAPFDPGAAISAGRVFALSGVSGAVIHSLAGSESFGLLGFSVASAGDVDGDTVQDIVVGAPEEDSNGTDAGSVYLYSGATGAILAHHFGDAAGDELGASVCGLGDLDGDGRAEYAAGAPHDDNNGTDSGAVRIWSSQTGLPLFTLDGNSAGDRFGHALADLGDLNGDGKHDLAVGAPNDDQGGSDAGSVAALSGATGLALFQVTGAPGQLLGGAVASAGDVDGDGTLDLLVGGRGGNVASARSGADGALLQDLPAPAGSSAWGASVAGGLHIDGDGRAEVAVGDEFLAGGGTVITFADHSLLGSSYCAGDGGAASCPCGNTGGTDQGCANSTGSGASLSGLGSASVSADDLVLQAQGLVASQPALLFAGLNRVQAGNGALFGDGLRCAGGAVLRLGIRVPDGGGAAAWGPGLAGAAGWAAGDTRRLQVWYRDPFGSPCGAAFNLSNGFELPFVQ